MKIFKGCVLNYDPSTMTAEVSRMDGTGIATGVSLPYTAYDLVNGRFNFSPPTIGAPCLCCGEDGDAVILSYYAPPNLDEESDPSNLLDSIVNRRAPTMQGGDALPGESFMSNGLGGSIGSSESGYSIKIAPLFYSLWNVTNFLWDTVCNKFKFTSPASSVVVDVDNSNNTNVNIKVRTNTAEKVGISAVNLDIGKTANVILLKINDKPLLHIDLDRNVTLTAKNIKITSENVDWNFNNMTLVGSELNAEGVGAVKLP